MRGAMNLEVREDLDFPDFFRRVLPTTEDPYPYQKSLALEAWPDLLDVPTGLGKTAGVTLAWLFKRLVNDAETPRRLIWCLPMRVLVEQTRENVETWLMNAAPFFEQAGVVLPRSYALMGGDADDSWVERPEDPAILIGTQDMLLSRAMMRGYATSRYRWPLDYALVHNDALWVFDEVQLMGAGLTTSAQLEAFRRDPQMPAARTTRSIWLSATLRPEWLATVDFRSHLESTIVLRLTEEEKEMRAVRRRREAAKTLQRAEVRLDGMKKSDVGTYVERLAELILHRHDGEAPTLVVLNSVDRAQRLKQALDARIEAQDGSTDVLLVHARFRQAERERLNRRLRGVRASEDLIVVGTQAIEAGVDVTSRRLFTELASWSALVQRFGRCNRGGEYDEAAVFWIDFDTDAEPKLARPYELEVLRTARETLRGLTSVSAARLPPVTEEQPLTHVIRRKDFVELFNTDPDLSGFDIDISPYLRDSDSGSAQLQVFWREFDDRPGEQPRPARAEMCPVSISQLREHLGKEKNRAFAWDSLTRQWAAVAGEAARPGQTLMLRCADGGYDAALGFVPKFRDRKRPVEALSHPVHSPPAYGDDVESQLGRFVALTDHLRLTETEAAMLCDELGETTYLGLVVRAALWHDVGKAHRAAQTAYLDHAVGRAIPPGTLWAKSPGTGRPHYRIQQDGAVEERRHFRHELASMLAWLEHGEPGEGHDLVAYLIAAHHGKVRLGLRALPGEREATDGRLFARGVWEGDVLPPLVADGLVVPRTTLRLDVMRLGDGPMGPSWTARTRRLLREHGPFRLAWLEALVRIADWRASAAVAGTADVEVRA
jgi:CRISPR-associated endonuclease/helicase Cas3